MPLISIKLRFWFICNMFIKLKLLEELGYPPQLLVMSNLEVQIWNAEQGLPPPTLAEQVAWKEGSGAKKKILDEDVLHLFKAYTETCRISFGFFVYMRSICARDSCRDLWAFYQTLIEPGFYYICFPWTTVKVIILQVQLLVNWIDPFCLQNLLQPRFNVST